MIVLDSDTRTFFLRNHPRVVERMRQATEVVAITIIYPSVRCRSCSRTQAASVSGRAG